MNSYRDPVALWLASPNFWLDREGHDMAIQPAYVVIHTMVGTIASANSRFQIPSEGASAHYGVGLDGRLVQWVDEKDAAWHAGNAGINLDSIGIEHEDGGRYNDPRPDALYAASAALVRRICLRYAIPIDRAHIREHREVSDAPTACPDALDVERIVRMAAGAKPPPTQISSAGGEGSMLQITGQDGRIHRLIVAEGGTDDLGNRGGPVHWIVIVGGTGGLDGWQGGDGELPGGGGWVAAGTLAASLWTWPERQRELLIVEGRGPDGAIWRKALFADDFTVEAEWAHAAGPVPAIPGQAPVPGPQGPAGPPGQIDVKALTNDVLSEGARRMGGGG